LSVEANRVAAQAFPHDRLPRLLNLPITLYTAKFWYEPILLDAAAHMLHRRADSGRSLRFV